MNPILEKIGQYGIVPVVVLERVEDAIPLASALMDGGLPIAEITFRTDVAIEGMQRISDEFPEMLIGAGTVLNENQVDMAYHAGAKFIVSPGLNPKSVSYCKTKEILMLPGCSNASNLEMAIELGLEVVKFFPAQLAGGLPMIKALSQPYQNMFFMPTGGIDESNIEEYLRYPKILACGGSWMVKSDLIRNGDFNEIKRLTIQAVNLVQKIRGIS